jgi:hypothetical protein
MRKATALICLVVFISGEAIAGKSRKDVPPAPLPAVIVSAEKIFLTNGGGSDLAYDAFYSEMKKWGKYEIVGSPDEVICDIHHTPMEIVQYRWSLFPTDNNVSTFLHCLQCTLHYSPLQGYVDINGEGMDTSNRRMNQCPSQHQRWHGSMAIVGVNGDHLEWKCLHQECREKV